MKKILTGVAVLMMLANSGCGYSTRSLLPGNYKNIFVLPVENKIDYMSQDQRKLYIPGIETRVRSGLIDRFMFDGNLRISDQMDADLELEAKLLSFDREELQLTTNADVKEYRLRIVVALKIIDKADSDKILWEEPSFAGEATYFISGPQARSEEAAINDCLKDLAQRVVARTIENW
jgi:hypothetical protein